MDRKKLIDGVLISLIVVTLVASVATATFKSILYDLSFYEEEFEDNGVYERLPKEIVDDEMRNILDYFRDSSELLDSYTFNRREILHMYDVKQLIVQAEDLHLVSLLLLGIILVSMFFFDETRRKSFIISVSYALMIGGAIMILGLPVMYLISLDFSGFFLSFHQAAFDNDLWQLDPSMDKLIVMFPEPFFLHFMQKLITLVFFKGIFFLLMGLFLKRYALSR